MFPQFIFISNVVRSAFFFATHRVIIVDIVGAFWILVIGSSVLWSLRKGRELLLRSKLNRIGADQKIPQSRIQVGVPEAL